MFFLYYIILKMMITAWIIWRTTGISYPLALLITAGFWMIISGICVLLIHRFVYLEK